ncbi:ComEC/Rec2 family competence protein [Arthrobacter sp. NPDC092385]|uniref:ComEC/Rec2 family competence protein n=1 Tax=Arthrobacter sp. NPDC092385 TaxID=3363943 RepID=UPI0037FC737B
MQATACGLLSAAVGLVLSCMVFLRPAGGGGRWASLPSQALASVAALALVLLAAGGSLARAEAGPVDEAMLDGTPFTALLRISGEPSSLPPGPFGGGDRYLVDADVIGGVLRGETFASTTPVVVMGTGPWARMSAGDTVRVLGTAKPADRVGRAAAVFLPASTPTVGESEGWLGYTGDLRTRFQELSQRDGRDGGLLPGMALGDRIGLDPDLEADMRTTGLTHLTAVSGANCSYVVAFAFLGLRLVRFPRLPSAVGAVLALVCFVMLVRPEPSVLRAAVMGAIGVAAVLSGRGRVSLALLMLSIIVLLAVDPWLSVSFAFMLSVAATLGLVTAGPGVVDALERVMPRFAAQLLAIPLTAQLFCTPILVLIQPALPVYSLPANVLASPVVPVITLLGMAAVLALVAAPVLAHPLVVAAQWGTRWVAGVAEGFAAAPAASMPWLPGAPGAVLAALASLTLLLVLVRQVPLVAAWRRATNTSTRPGSRAVSAASAERAESGPGGEPAPGSGRRRTPLVLAVVLTLCLAGGVVLSGRWSVPGGDAGMMAMCDVGQGDGVVVGTTPGHAMVVDTGPDPEAMDRCLDSLGVEVIDALVITHLHDDHYGGVAGAVRGRTVTALYYSTGEHDLPAEVTEAASAAGLEPKPLDDETALDLAPLRVDVLWPVRDAGPSEENNASAVLEVEVPTPVRPVTILLTGDLEEDAAAVVLSRVPSLRDGRVDILKVAHHGARNGGTAVIEAVDPILALISVGEGNDYGHPHPSILDALDAAGVATARTDELGAFTVDLVDTALEVRPLR